MKNKRQNVESRFYPWVIVVPLNQSLRSHNSSDIAEAEEQVQDPKNKNPAPGF